jgi:hypothetical protein
LHVPLDAHESLQLPSAQPALTATEPEPEVVPVALPPVVPADPVTGGVSVVPAAVGAGAAGAGSVAPVAGELGEPSCFLMMQPVNSENARPNAVRCDSFMIHLGT